jgi:hypothetical protein
VTSAFRRAPGGAVRGQAPPKVDAMMSSLSPEPYNIVAVSSATRSPMLSAGKTTSTIPVGPSLTGIADVRMRTPDESSGATRQVISRREPVAAASTTADAAEASA